MALCSIKISGSCNYLTNVKCDKQHYNEVLQRCRDALRHKSRVFVWYGPQQMSHQQDFTNSSGKKKEKKMEIVMQK